MSVPWGSKWEAKSKWQPRWHEWALKPGSDNHGPTGCTENSQKPRGRNGRHTACHLIIRDHMLSSLFRSTTEGYALQWQAVLRRWPAYLDLHAVQVSQSWRELPRLCWKWQSPSRRWEQESAKSDTLINRKLLATFCILNNNILQLLGFGYLA